MNKPFKINVNDYENIYTGSDFHYNHQRDFIFKPRGFETYQDHDKFIREQCETLTVNDLLIYLGDYSLNTTDEQTSELLHKTKARIFYIQGNHEGYHSRFSRDSLMEYAKQYGGLHDDISNSKNVTIFPFSVNKTTKEGHIGIAPKRKDVEMRDITYFGEDATFQLGNSFWYVRHMAPLIWDKMKCDNYYAIFGHSHSNLKGAQPTDTTNGLWMDVGMDNAKSYNGTAFFSRHDIETLMKRKVVKIHDHHGD